MSLLHKNIIKKNKKINLKQIPELEECEKVQYHFPEFETYLENLKSGNFFTGYNIYKMVSNTFRKEFILTHIYIALAMGMKSINSIPI